MPWYLFAVPESIKKRVCIYLLQRYLGQFFEEKLRLDQLSLDIYNGTGTLANVSLDVQALNELGEKQNWPMEFVDGYLEKLYISVPWKALLSESTFLEVRGLQLTVQPKQRHEQAASMFESMWSSMSSSMQMAQECMTQNTQNEASQPYEGIEKFAQTIDSVLSKVKVKFINTVIQVEHVPKDSLSGVGIKIEIERMEYSDDAGNDPPLVETSEMTAQEQTKTYLVNSFTSKKFSMEGISVSTVEFPTTARTFSRSVMEQSGVYSGEPENPDSLLNLVHDDQNADARSCTESEEDESNADETINAAEEIPNALKEQRHEVLFAKIPGRQELNLRMKQTDSMMGPKVSIELAFGSLIMFLSPRQVHLLVELANGFAQPDMEDRWNSRLEKVISEEKARLMIKEG